MKRLVTIVSLLAVLALPASAFAQGAPYAWSISASNTNEFMNTSAPTLGLRTVYLWLACCELPPGMQDGMATAEFDIVANSISHVATVMQNDFLNAGGTTNLQMAVGGCPCGPIVAANLVIIDLPGTLDLAPSAANGVGGTADCEANPQLWPIDWRGYSNLGAAPNGKGLPCQFATVERSSWGTIKGLYR